LGIWKLSKRKNGNERAWGAGGKRIVSKKVRVKNKRNYFLVIEELTEVYVEW
jgi:hypothetical protein